MKKWFLRITLSVLTLLLLLAAAVQVVLWTDLPKNWVLGALQEKLQLRITAQNLSTGWLGHTSLSGVVVSLPLEDEAVLQTKDLSIKHTSLLALIVGRPLRVQAITIDHPNLLVRQRPDGRWNLQQVAELIRRAGGGKTPQTQAPEPNTNLPELPAVSVNDGILRVIDNSGHQATLSPLSISAAPQGTLVWTCDAAIPGQLHIKGDVAPGGMWEHQATVELSNLEPIVRPFLANPSPQVLSALKEFKLAGDWTGRISGSLTGRLDLTQFSLSGYSATGPLGLAFNQADEGIINITPAGLVVRAPATQQLPPARIESGAITIDGRRVSSPGLTLALAGGEMRLAAQYAWKAGEGELQANWNHLVLPPGATHGGALTASIHQRWPNQPVVQATLASDGAVGSDTWTASLKLDGAGIAWNQIDWKLSASKLNYQHASQTYNLDNLLATLSTRGNLLTLDSLSIPPGALYGKWQRGLLNAQGKYDLSNGNWNVYLAGSNWPVIPAAKAPADFIIDVSGDNIHAYLKQFFLDGKDLRIWANGDISYGVKGMPGAMHVFGWYPPLDYTWHERGVGDLEQVHVTGRLWSELHLTKNLWPPNLDIQGTLYGKALNVEGHPLGDLAIKLAGTANPDRMQISTSRMELLGGVWGLDANLRYQKWLANVDLQLKDLSLAKLDNFAAPPPNIRGTLAGRWSVHLPEFDLNRMTADGEYEIRNLGRFAPPPPVPPPPPAIASRNLTTNATGAIQAAHIQPATTGPLALATRPATMPAAAPATQPTHVVPIADVVTGNVKVSDGLVVFDPIRLQRTPERGSQGEARARLSFPIYTPRQMRLEATAAAWPLSLLNTKTDEISNLLIWAQTKGLDIDLKQLAATGPVGLDASIAFKDQSVKVHVASQLQGRRIALQDISGDGLGGHIEGSGFVDLDHPLQSSGVVRWNDVQAQSLVELAPALDGLMGRYSGIVNFAPTDPRTDRDATGPFAVNGQLRSQGGNWKGLPIGDATFVAHADYQPQTSASAPSARAVLDQLNWNLADGNLKGWSRVTWYNREPFLQINLDLDQLNLDPIVRALRPPNQPHKPMPGRLTGKIMAAGNPFTDRGQRVASGEAHIRLTDSDLVNVPAINLLYSVMSVQLGPPIPTGKGVIEARLEGKRLEIPTMRYFNRGAQVWANAAVVDLFQGGQSPVEGTAAGSVRPLRDLKLPFMSDIDRTISALTGSLVTVSLEGIINDPKPRVIPFAESSDTFRRFMLGEVKNEVRGTSGR